MIVKQTLETVYIKSSTIINKIYIFEAGIDMLSYYQLYKNNLNDCLLLSTGGSQKINKIAKNAIIAEVTKHLK